MVLRLVLTCFKTKSKEMGMPIYEFQCQECGNPFEELVFSSSKISELTCPSCGSENIRKKMSIFASKVAGKTSFGLGSTNSASCSTGST